MKLHVPISEDLVSVLDRVLDKSIVVESSIRMGLQEVDLRVADAKASVTSSAVYAGYGDEGSWQEGKGVKELFPYWRRDLWTK